MYQLCLSIFRMYSLSISMVNPSGLLLASSRKAASSRSTSVQISFFCRQSKLLHCSPVLSGTPWAMLERNCAMRVKYPLGFQCSQLILQNGNLAAQWKGKRKNRCLCQSRKRPSGLKGCLFLKALRMGLWEELCGGVWRGLAWSSFLMGMVESSSYSSKMDSFSSKGEEGAVVEDTFDSFFTIFPKLFQINYIIIELLPIFQIQGA